jgi:hypothetical protein
MRHPQKSETRPVEGPGDAKQNTESAAIVALGVFPPHADSAMAELLADMLEGKRQTVKSIWNDNSLYRASSAVGNLRNKYGWPIITEQRSAGCRDGRLSHIGRYCISPAVRAAAFAAGAADRIAEIRAARAKLRLKAAQARRRADALNAISDTARDADHPGQGDLFGNAA